MLHPLVQDLSQRVSRQQNPGVQALPPQRAQQPLTQGIGPGTSERGFEDPQPQMAHTLVETLGENTVPVMEQKPVVIVRRDRCTQLLLCPWRAGMRRHVDVQDAACGMFDDHKHI